MTRQSVDFFSGERMLQAVALDVGTARIGVAVTDARGQQALPLLVVERKGTRTDIAKLLPILDQHRAALIVVGLPRQDDQDDRSARLARQFAQALAGAQQRPVVLVDETETTVQAHDELRALGLRAARRRREVDKHAAKQILDRWLAGALAENVAAIQQ